MDVRKCRGCGGVYCEKIDDCRPWPCRDLQPQMQLFEYDISDESPYRRTGKITLYPEPPTCCHAQS